MSQRITLVSVMQYTFLFLILQHGVSNMFSVGAKRAARMVFVGTHLTDRGEKKRLKRLFRMDKLSHCFPSDRRKHPASL